MVRAWVAFAEGKRDGEVFSSSTTVEMPRRPSSIASISPHGPAPVMTTPQSTRSATPKLRPASLCGRRYTIEPEPIEDRHMNATVAVIAQGAMGAGVGGRLVERGLHVITSLAGRSEASAKRAREAGMVAVSDQECAQADYFLSILPPSEALSLARKMAALIGPNNKKPVYVDCNAVSPPTKVEIGNVITKAGAPFVDVGIIGMPPTKDGGSPW